MDAGEVGFRVEDLLETLGSGGVGIDPRATITPGGWRDATLAAPSGDGGPGISAEDLSLLTLAEHDEPGADLVMRRVLGEGGMGRVLLAWQRSLRREVALKVVKGGAPEDDRQRLLGEALVTGSLEHPSIVPVHAIGRDAAGLPVMVMKRVEGVSWSDLCHGAEHPAWAALAPEKDGRLDAHLEILMAACNALHFAHSRGIVHRDVKLDNVMIGSFGEVYVVDWGIAARAAQPGEDLRRPGPLVGTPA